MKPKGKKKRGRKKNKAVIKSDVVKYNEQREVTLVVLQTSYLYIRQSENVSLRTQKIGQAKIM